MLAFIPFKGTVDTFVFEYFVLSADIITYSSHSAVAGLFFLLT